MNETCHLFPAYLFPARLRELREGRRMTRTALSECCGLSKNCIARYERRESVPSLADAIVIADYFGVSLDWMCGREK
jgi:transcriptional regulator with XRE-family HTH domain